MIVDIVQKVGRVQVSVATEHKLELLDLPLPGDGKYWVYEETSEAQADPTVRNWNGRPVRLVQDDQYDAYSLTRFLKSQPAEVQAKFRDTRSPRVWAYDFETEIVDGFPDAESAKTPIISAALSGDTPELSTVVWTIDKIDSDGIAKVQAMVNEHLSPLLGRQVKVHVQAVPDERSLLASFAKAAQLTDVLTGWNVDGYDWPYWENRCKLYATPSKPFGTELMSKTGLAKRGRPVHKVCQDYMSMFKDYGKWLIPNCQSVALDYVSKHLLRTQKLDYHGMSLKELREKDLPRFLAYNAIDTALVILLHRKINVLQTVYALAVETGLPVSDARGPVKHSAAPCFDWLLEHRPDLVWARPISREKPEPFEGGYVKVPVRPKGDWVCCLDFAGLYPSIMETFNLSPENWLRPLQDDDFDKFKDDPDFMIAVGGSLYDNRQDSMYRQVQAKLRLLRKVYKDAQFATGQKIWQPIEQEIERRGITWD